MEGINKLICIFLLAPAVQIRFALKILFVAMVRNSLGFLTDEMQLIAFNPADKFIYCSNHEYDTCTELAY